MRRVGAVPAMGAAAAAVAVAVRVRLAVVRGAVAAADAVAVEASQNTGDEEEDAVHDAEGEGGLEHGARLVGAGVQGGDRGAAEGAEADVVGVAARDVGAVGRGDEAQGPDGADEGADEQEVDGGDEGGVGGGAVVAEEGVDGPGQGQHRHDEEHQDVVGRQLVQLHVAVDEVG